MGQRDMLILAKHRVRLAALIVADLLISVAAFYFAVLLRFGFTFPPAMRLIFWNWFIFLFLLKFSCLLIFRLYNISLRFVGIVELLRLLSAFVFSTASAVLLDLFFVRSGDLTLSMPVGVLLIDGLVSFGLFGAVRVSRRIYLEIVHQNHKNGKPTLIVGANLKSERLIKELRYSRSRIEPVLIADLEDRSSGDSIFNLPVVNYHGELTREIKRNHIEAALINLPTANHHEVRDVFNKLKKAGVNDIRIVPRMDEWRTSIHQIRKVNIEDLLARDAVRIDFKAIADEFASKPVLVTGAAGSIGSEIVRKMNLIGARSLIALDSDESGIFHLQQEIVPYLKPHQNFSFVIGSIRDADKMRRVFARFQPKFVFHAAAYKHVPLMEHHPEEALRTNVLGTITVAGLAIEHHVEKFVNISTDKAVKPRSIMGASKRLAEMACQAFNGNGTSFLSVRFGNVLGSRGSVVPLFQEQISRGGPITLTHPEMRRYFMSIPEAVLLVFQAAFQGKGGEVFVLDMGDPVRILDLAENLIRLNGLEPGKDIEIVISGIRPGEKLYEELLTAEEGVDATNHNKIFIARFSEALPGDLVERMTDDCRCTLLKPEEITSLFRAYIPTFCRS